MTPPSLVLGNTQEPEPWTGHPQVGVTCDPLDILSFLKQDLHQMNMICERVEMFEERTYDQTEAVFEYFGLPFAPQRVRQRQEIQEVLWEGLER